MLETAIGSIQISPIARGLTVAFEPIRLPSGQAAAIAEVKHQLSSDPGFVLVAALRQHGHIGNVLTHISGANWTKAEQAIRAILDSDVGSEALSPLAQNIVELICGDRGVTGRIMKPYFQNLLGKMLGMDRAARLTQRISDLFIELQCPRCQPSNIVKIAGELPAAESN